MKHFGLIGNPLAHSFSESFFTEKFARENINADYKLFPLPDLDKDFPELLAANPDLCGLNVTIPYKQKIFTFLDEVVETAKEIGAVNVIRFERNAGKRKLIGYNSDVVGFHDSLVKQLKPHHTHALILGTGGAAKAVAYVLKKLGIVYTFVSRAKKDNNLTYSELSEEVMQKNLLIVNASPLGTFPKTDEFPDIPYQMLTDKHYLFDLIYNPAETVFLRHGREHGCATQNGLEMLHGQAIAAWEIWTR